MYITSPHVNLQMCDFQSCRPCTTLITLHIFAWPLKQNKTIDTYRNSRFTCGKSNVHACHSVQEYETKKKWIAAGRPGAKGTVPVRCPVLHHNPAQEDKEALSSLLIPCTLWNPEAPHQVHHSLPLVLLLTLMKAPYPFTIHFKISPPSYSSVFHVFHPFSFPYQINVRIFWSKREKVTGSCRKLHSENLHDLYCSPNKGNWTERDEMDGVCCMYGTHEKCVEDFCIRTWRRETTWMMQA